jgi:hypothetical protein
MEEEEGEGGGGGGAIRRTLSSSSGIDVAKRLASSEISSSLNKGMACVELLRFGSGRLFCDGSFDVGDDEDAAEGL